MENYELKYKRALKNARNFYEAANKSCATTNPVLITSLELLFPELKESEDERIKKLILELVSISGNGNQWQEINDWLEKQLPQKTLGQAEPKFREGDIIKHNKSNVVCEVVSANEGVYLLEIVRYGNKMELSNVEENFHLWTIKDAEPGDVIACVGNDGCAQECGIFKRYGCKYEDCDTYDETYCFAGGCTNCYETYCVMDCNDIFRPAGHICGKKIRPASKAQRDLLFSKMKEAGYKWYDDGLKLTKIIQYEFI